MPLVLGCDGQGTEKADKDGAAAWEETFGSSPCCHVDVGVFWLQ